MCGFFKNICQSCVICVIADLEINDDKEMNELACVDYGFVK